MAKEKTELVTELMDKPKNIRNIGIAAHIDHGKCVSKDSRIILNDGNVMKAEELLEFSKNKGKEVFRENDKVIYDVSKFNINVFSLNKENGKLETKPITYAWKLSGGNLIKLALRNGFDIKTTPEHKYVIFEDFKFKEKEAKDLKVGDRVVCPRKLHIKSNECIKKFILKRLATENFYACLNKNFGKKLKKKILSFGIEKLNKKIKSDIKYKSLYHGCWKNRYRIQELLEISKILKIDLEVLYENIQSICYRSGRRQGKSSLKMHLPQNFQEFFYAAGLMFGDGSGNKFVVGKPDLENIFVSICNKLGIHVYYRNYEGKTKEVATNETFSRVLNCLFNYPLKRKSHNISLSEILWKTDKNYVGAFLRGYFDTDGSVEKARSAISLTSASKKMLKGLSLLLLRFGCVPNLQNNTLYISGYSAKKFRDEIGFKVKEKALRLNNLVNKTTGSTVSDVVIIKHDSNSKSVSKTGLQSSLITEEKRILLSELLEDLAFIEIKKLEQDFEDVVYDFTVQDNHNFVSEGIIIHNTTLSDNLLFGAGMISEELAGKQLYTDFDEQEQKRGITIFSANVTMVHKFDNENYLINLIDTPGHVDFGGDVTRAMRAVDGAIIVACAVEGVMPQTETVIRQALRERVKPILFINKVDRMIKELQLSPEKMQERFTTIIKEVNKLIQKYSEKEYADKWMVKVEDGSVAFGSAYKKWAISLPFMKSANITFKDVIDYASQDKDDELARKAPLHTIVLNMVTRHLPNPVNAQEYRIPKIWHGDETTSEGQDMVKTNPRGNLAAVITKVVPDPHAGLVATARIFSGTINKGQEVSMVGQGINRRLQQVSIYKGPQRVQMDRIPAGNIVGIVGLNEAFSGETITSPESEMEGFEKIKHIFEPVVTKSIEPKSPKDLTKLIGFLRQVSREDPTLQISINEETGEYLVSGLGELHINAKIERPLGEKGIEVTTSPPIVVYRETLRQESEIIEGKSANKHNRFYITVSPMPAELYEAFANEKIQVDNIKKELKNVVNDFVEYGLSRNEAKKIKDLYKRNLLIDATKGIQHLGETFELITEAFRSIVNSGPLAHEPCSGLIVRIVDAKLHEDSIHRGPAQVIPAVGDALRTAIMTAKPTLLEPIQRIRIDVPEELMGDAMSQVQNRRGQVINVNTELGVSVLRTDLPVAEMFGFEAVLKSATAGKGFYSLIDVFFKKIPEDLKDQVIKQIKQRKGITS